MEIRIHAFEPFSRANGPGLRAVVWMQGCTLHCPGCFNPATHDPTGGCVRDTEELATQILELGDRIEGISLSGGEPLQQPEALLDLLQRLSGTPLSCLLFSGYTLPEIYSLPLGAGILQYVDVLIAGLYDCSMHSGKGLIGSANQNVHLLTPRYGKEDLERIPPRELILHRDGTLTGSGIDPWPCHNKVTPKNKLPRTQLVL